MNTTESPAAESSVPVRPTERVGMVDALRGFALFGVLLANLGDFSLVWAVPAAEKAALPTATWDQTTQFLRYFLVREKFFGIGLGLGGKVSMVFLTPMALGIFLLQIGFSWIWLRSFRFGPLEWLWRSLTYRRWQPLRVRPAEPVPEPAGR